MNLSFQVPGIPEMTTRFDREVFGDDDIEWLDPSSQSPGIGTDQGSGIDSRSHTVIVGAHFFALLIHADRDIIFLKNCCSEVKQSEGKL